MLTQLGSNHGQKEQQNASKACLNSEVILILGEPTLGDLSALLQPGVSPWKHWPVRQRRRRLLIFASDIRGLPESVFQTLHVDIHVLSRLSRESSGPHSQSPEQPPSEAIHLVGVFEKASQFAAAWRADAERLIRDDPLIKKDIPYHDGAHSLHLSNATYAFDRPKSNHAVRITRATLNDVSDDIRSELHRDHQYPRLNSNSESTKGTLPGSKKLLPDFQHFGSTSVPRPSSPSIYQTQDTGCSTPSPNQHFLDPFARTFDAILNFLPTGLTEKLLLKQVILVSTLCGQYSARSKPESPLGSGRASGPFAGSSKSRFPSTYPERHPNLKETGNSLCLRISTTKTWRTSTASSGSSSASAFGPSARSPTPNSTPSSSQRRWSMLSWLSTTSASQASNAEPGATKIDVSDANERKFTVLRRRLSYLFGRTPKRFQSSLNQSVQNALVITEGDCDNGPMKIEVQQTPHYAYLIHVLPTSWISSSPSHISHRKTRNLIHAEPESLEKKRRSPSPLSMPLSQALGNSTESATTSFTRSRMQTSLMRRATDQQTRLRNLERRNSMPASFVERGASRTDFRPMPRNSLLTKGPLQPKAGRPLLAENMENFLGDYFRQGKGGGFLPFVLDFGLLGREISVDGRRSGSKGRLAIGEALLSGLLDEFAMSGQCWVGDQGQILADLIRVSSDEAEVPPIQEEQNKSPLIGLKHPPPAAISLSPSPSSSSVGAESASNSSSQRGRSRADFESPLLATRIVNATLSGQAMNALREPEPAYIQHLHPPSKTPGNLDLELNSVRLG